MKLSERTSTRSLASLFSPASVAILGASSDPTKWGNWLARRALRGSHRRAVYLVNRNGGEILGHSTHRSLAELPQPAELVVVCLPAHALESAVDDAMASGARAVVAISGGQVEGDAGGARDAAVAARVRAAGGVLLGPNCLGVFDGAAELELVPNELPKGSVGLVSQSGNLALEVGLRLTEVGLGFSRFASLGNQADIQAVELIRALADHEQTELIALYCEDFRDGRGFVEAAHAAIEAGKPVVLLTIAGSGAAARAVRSHTGALASDSAAIDAACRAAGIERVFSPQDLVDLSQALLRTRPMRGRRTAIVADSGGHAAIAASLAQGQGLEVPTLSRRTADRLRAVLPASAACSNPVDLAGGGEQDIHTFERAVQLLLDSDEVDGVLMAGYFGGYSHYAAELAGPEVEVGLALGRIAARADHPLVVQTMYPAAPAVQALREGGVAVYDLIERATAVLARLAARRAAQGVPEMPAPAAPVSTSDYRQARELIASAGLRIAPAVGVGSVDEAIAAASDVGYPVVLKALGMLHKSDTRGVALDLADEPALRRSFEDMSARLDPPSYSVERMVAPAGGVELLIGARWDVRFGPIALVGLGGVYTEIIQDVAVALAPVGPEEAERMLRSLRAAPLLVGARGRAPIDLEAAATALARLSELAASHPEIAELEVNPLLASPKGAVALDARVVLRAPPNPL